MNVNAVRIDSVEDRNLRGVRPRARTGQTGATAALLPDGRLHLNHGPIDLVIGAEGPRAAQQAAYFSARRVFKTILTDLMDEIDILRAPMGRGDKTATGAVARLMLDATRNVQGLFVTPMAAVAGAVADYVLGEMIKAAPLDFAEVNNGGGIAFWAGGRRRLRIGIVCGVTTGVHPAVA